MSNHTFIARLTRGAVASTIAAGFLTPDKHSMVADAPVEAREISAEDSTLVPEASAHSEDKDTVIVMMPNPPTEWTRPMDREFRKLALAEAKGVVTPGQLRRLEELSKLRDRLDHPRTAEEVLVQLKRDRMLEKISETIREYVEFQEGASRTGFAAK